MARPFRTHRKSNSFLLTAGLLIAFCISALVGQAACAQDVSEQETLIAQTAANAQNEGEFPLAASQWETLLKDHPNSSLTGLAEHNLGICFVQMQRYEEAAVALKSSLASLDKNETEKLASSYLFLGFAQARLGKDIGDKATTDEAKEESIKWLTTATQTFDQLRRRFPDFGDLDQACFFQGEAYSTLERFEKAIESYENMLTLPKGAFKFDGILALGETYNQLGNYDKAIEYFDRFTKEAKQQGGHSLQADVDYQKALTLLKKADGAESRGENDVALKNYGASISLFDKAAADPTFEFKTNALDRKAFALHRQRKFAESAQLYSQIANDPEYPMAARARVYAGRDYLSANRVEEAETELKKAIELDSPLAADGAHWLSQLYLRTRRNNEAFALAESWIAKADEANPIFVSLKLDRADAAYMIAEKRAESPALFLDIADNHPNAKLAPTALYNAAFAFLEIKKFKEAISTADRFQENYESNEYLPDTLEVKADANLLLGKPQIAETIFRRLAQDYSTNPKSSVWNLRVGLAQYMQEKYQETIDWLSPMSDHMTDKAQLAEALHWIGSSQYQLKNDTEAITALQTSFNTHPQWQRADETLLTLSQAQARAGQAAAAQQTTQMLLEQFPRSSVAAKAAYRLGDLAYENKDWKTAETHYQNVVENFSKSELAPHALYGCAWSLIEQKDYKRAIEVFDSLLSEFPDHERSRKAKIGRGAIFRLSGDTDGAINELTEFLATNPTGKPKIDAMYELGLTYIDAKKWDEVAKTFGSLLELAPDSKLVDRFHYELAWANLSRDKKEDALVHFEKIATDLADSPLAPEANFHIANRAYETKDFDAAASSFTKCLNSKAADSLREKAAYKLAWCRYKQKEFDKALDHFRNQVNSFPNGNLHADGLLMVSDSLYRLEKHEQAYEAYRVAKPAIEASKTVDARVRWQALLHGGQSANKAGKFNEAIEFVQPIIQSDVTSEKLKRDAWLEVGNANKGVKNLDDAIDAWSKAAADIGETGAEARCMIGEALFEQEKFDEAIKAYKLVFYGYGGKDSAPDIKPWQAFAAFEAAQCNYVQIKDADPKLRPSLIAEATKHFQYLVKNYPNDQLVEEATKRLNTLKQLK